MPHEPPETPASGTSENESLLGFRLTFAALTLLGIPVSWFVAFVSVMSSDSCMGGATGWICHASGQQVAFALPWLGWLLAITASVVGFARRRHHPSAPWFGLFTGGLLYLLVPFAGAGVMSALYA